LQGSRASHRPLVSLFRHARPLRSVAEHHPGGWEPYFGSHTLGAIGSVERSSATGRSGAISSGKSTLVFDRWLQDQLKARKLTQRQLAQRSGVDHSTVSRLLRGRRMPTLRTAELLARGLGLTGDPGGLEDQRLGSGSSPTARVEYALRSDDLLDDRDVRSVMNVYLAARLRTASKVNNAVKRAWSNTPEPTIAAVTPPRRAARSSSVSAVTSARD
jgi:transcriptional regulator with XRE-family HTH domain